MILSLRVSPSSAKARMSSSRHSEHLRRSHRLRAASATRPPRAAGPAASRAPRRPLGVGRGLSRAGTTSRSRCGASRRGGSSSSPRRSPATASARRRYSVMKRNEVRPNVPPAPGGRASTKRTFASKSRGRRQQRVVGLHERHVEDVAEGVGDLLARAAHVVGDGGGIGDHLVLEARVELHVARLVDLLGGEERRLLLGRVGGDQPGELGGDALLGDHQRGEHEEDDLALGPLHLLPLTRGRSRGRSRTATTAGPPSGGTASGGR